MSEPVTLAHVYNPSTQGARAGGLGVQDQHSKTSFSPNIKKINKKQWFSYSEINVMPDILTKQ